jgi:hypothetical protein
MGTLGQGGLPGGTCLEARRQPGRQRSYDVDVDAPMVALARRAVTVGWHPDLAAWFVPSS